MLYKTLHRMGVILELLKRTWAEINLDALENNYKNIEQLANEREIMCVVKADAYGHGAMEAAPLFDKLGCSSFAVSNIREAILLREYGIKKDILILGHTPCEYACRLAEYGITQSVFSKGYAKELSRSASRDGVSVNIHFKVDTGMGRIGFNCRDEGSIPSAADEIEVCYALPSLKTHGIFMHFSAADSYAPDDKEYCRAQYARFGKIVAELKSRGVTFEKIHCCNSAAICLQDKNEGNVIRPGNILYGLTPSTDISVGFTLSPALSLKSTVSMVKIVRKGDYISYGRTFRAEDDMKIATATIGYADGYPRALSGNGRVLIRGQFAPITGRICMDQLMVDVSGIDGVSEGDTVTLIGKDGGNEITAEEVAVLSGTINYEIVCGISQRVPRLYMKNGKAAALHEYRSY